MLPPVTPDASLDDLRAQTLRRLAALAWLADIAESIVLLIRRWLAIPSRVGDGSRLRRVAERVRHAARVIAALEARLRESLRLIEAGVRPPSMDGAGRSSGDAPSETEPSERSDAADWRERPERLEQFFAPPPPPRLIGSTEEIVAGVIADLGAFPAWRRLAEAVWAGEDPTPDEVARILAGALIEAMPPPRAATATRKRPPQPAHTLHPPLARLAPSPPRGLPAPG